MSANKQAKIKESHFAGGGNLQKKATGGLAAALRHVLIQLARRRVDTENITGLTDSSGGSAGANIVNLTMPTSNDLTGLTTGVTAASANTAVDTVSDAYATLIGQINLVRAELGMGSLDDGEGTDGSGTVAAIDDTATGNGDDTDAASYASATSALNDLLDEQRTIVYAVDEIKAAVGLTAVPKNAAWNQGTLDSGGDLKAAITNLADVDPPVAAILLTEWDAAIDVLSDNVALLCDQIDLVTGVADTLELTHYAG